MHSCHTGEHNIAQRASQFLISSCVVFFVVNASRALVLVIVTVNNLEMKTKRSQPDPVSAASTRNSSHNTDTSSSLRKPRTKPTCARCRNHRILTEVKGHKRICPRRDCKCFKCHVVAEGGKFRAMQLAIWRSQKKQLWETDRNTSSQTDSHKSLEEATPPVPGTDSNAVADSDALLSLYGCYSAQNPSTSPAPNTIRNVIPPPQHQLTRWYNQNFESYAPLNAADTIVEERRESLPSSISISGKTQSVLPNDLQNNPFSTIPPEQLSYMTSHSVTIPPPQPTSRLSIPCGERFTNSGPFTKASALLTDTYSIKSGRDLLSSSGSTSGRTSPIDSNNYTNIASSIIQPQQQYLNLPPACCHYARQLQAATPMTDLLSVIDGSGSVSSSFATNTTVPNVPNTKRQFSLLCKNGFAPYPQLIAEAPVTDFRSIDSLSSSFTSKTSRTLPVIPIAWTNDDRTSLPTRQPVMRQTQCPCGKLPSCGASGTPNYDTLIRQYDLNSLFLKGR